LSVVERNAGPRPKTTWRRLAVSPSLKGAVINQRGPGSNIAKLQHCKIAAFQQRCTALLLARQLAWLNANGNS